MHLKVENLSKRIGTNWAFRDVSFEVKSDEIFGIFGPSDSEKNMLLRTIAGEMDSNDGSISIDGMKRSAKHSATYIDPSKSESRSFFSKIFANQSENNALQRLERIKNSITNAKGLLFINEPFCGFDLSIRLKLTDKLKSSVSECNLTTIIATADFETVLMVCDRATVMANGYILQTGTPQELYDKPDTRTVATLTGRNNLIEARRLTSSKSDLPEFQTIDGEHRIFTQKAELRSLGPINKSITLAIRPEQISISFGASFPEDNLIKAMIKDFQFLGSTTLVNLDCGGLKLQASVPRLVGIGKNDECMVGLPTERIRILKD